MVANFTYLWHQRFLWEGRRQELFAPSPLCVWSQMPWRSRQIVLLRGSTNPGQSRPGINGNEWILYIPRSPEFEPHHRMQFSVCLTQDYTIYRPHTHTQTQTYIHIYIYIYIYIYIGNCFCFCYFFFCNIVADDFLFPFGNQKIFLLPFLFLFSHLFASLILSLFYWCLSRLMRRWFRGRWTCPLVSEDHP